MKLIQKKHGKKVKRERKNGYYYFGIYYDDDEWSEYEWSECTVDA